MLSVLPSQGQQSSAGVQGAINHMTNIAYQAPLTWNPSLALLLMSSSSCASTKGKRRGDDELPKGGGSKKPRYFDPEYIELESEEEEEEPTPAEPFDPDSFHERARKLPESIEKYAQKHFRSCLKGSLRKAMSKENPLPDSKALQCLKTDDAIKDFMGKSFPKKLDDTYKRIQSSVNAAAAPALSLWRDLDEQGFSSGHEHLMPVDCVLEMIQKTLVLIGNSSNYVSQCRRDNIVFKMKRQNPTLGSALAGICQEHQPDEKLLFGGKVHKALTDRADSLSAMKKVSSKMEGPKTPSGQKTTKFFRQGPTSERGRGSGRTYRPLFKRQQHQQNRGKCPNQPTASSKGQ